MNGTSSPRRSAASRAAVFPAVLALTPLPALADQAGGPVPATPIRASAARIAASQPLSAAPVAAARTEQVTEGAPRSGAFFKTPAGVAVLAVMGAGFGYAIYSVSHDRVHSPGKK